MKIIIASIFIGALNFVSSVYAGDVSDRKESANEEDDVRHKNKRRRNDCTDIELQIVKPSTVKKQKQDIDEACNICMNLYDEGMLSPRILPCKHSLCTTCLTEILSQAEPKCPFDRRPISETTINDIPKNWMLLASLSRPILNMKLLLRKMPDLDSEELALTLSEYRRIELPLQSLKIKAETCEHILIEARRLRSRNQLVEILSIAAQALLLTNSEYQAIFALTEAGFALKGLGQDLLALEAFRKAAYLFNFCLKTYEHLPEEAQEYIQSSLAIIGIHILSIQLDHGWISPDEAQHKLGEIEAIIMVKAENFYTAQFKCVSAIFSHKIGDSRNALDLATEAITLTGEAEGIEICIMTFIQILADQVDGDSAIPSHHLLESHRVRELLPLLKRTVDHSEQSYNAKMGFTFFNLGRLARKYGLDQKALDFMKESIRLMQEGLTKLIAFKDELSGLPMELNFALPAWVRSAEIAVTELEEKLKVGQVPMPQPEIDQFFQGI